MAKLEPEPPSFAQICATLDLPQLQQVQRLLGEALAMVDNEKRSRALRDAVREVEERLNKPVGGI